HIFGREEVGDTRQHAVRSEQPGAEDGTGDRHRRQPIHTDRRGRVRLPAQAQQSAEHRLARQCGSVARGVSLGIGPRCSQRGGRWGVGGGPATIDVLPAKLAAAKYVREDDPKLWGWVIFPPNFRAPAMMELAKRQAWTLKPAVLQGSIK